MSQPVSSQGNPDRVIVKQGGNAATKTEEDGKVIVHGVGKEGPPGPTGGVGPTGPTGPAVSVDDVSYIHVQNPVASTWVINHNLGFVPNVRVVDSGGSTADGEVEVVDHNTLRISFIAGGVPSAFAGVAYLS